jgi:predicted permease
MRQNRIILLGTILQDLRYGVRMLARNLWSTLVMVLALALGIGVATTVFTAYKAMVARPLDARDASRMVNIALTRESGASTSTFSYPDFEIYRDSAHSFEGLIAFRLARVTLSNAGGMISQRTAAAGSGLGRLGLLSSGASNAEFATVYAVSENYFQVMGVTAMQGRTFESIGTSELQANPPVVISENYWIRRFAGDPAILGKTIHLNGLAVTVVGITPHDFVGTGIGAPAFWLPASIEPLIHADDQWLRNRENQRYRLFGRLAPGVSISQAQAEMDTIASSIRTLHNPRSEAAGPASVLVWPGSPFPLPISQYRGLRLAILLIMAAAAMVLIVACANVASLQMARARSRESELRTRLSLGASRMRVIRQLVTESAVVSMMAGLVALLVSGVFLKTAAIFAANALPVEYGTPVFDVTPDLEIFAGAFAISLLAGVLSGLTPALEGSRSALTSATRASTSTVRSRRIQDILVAAQVSLSLVLMIVGSMFIRSSMQSLRMDTGYASKQLIHIAFRFPESPKYTAARKLVLIQDLRTRLAAVPGVSAITQSRPPAMSRPRTAAIAIDGGGSPAQSILRYGYVQANYFQALGVPLTLGRSFPYGQARTRSGAAFA